MEITQSLCFTHSSFKSWDISKVLPLPGSVLLESTKILSGRTVFEVSQTPMWVGSLLHRGAEVCWGSRGGWEAQGGESPEEIGRTLPCPVSQTACRDMDRELRGGGGNGNGNENVPVHVRTGQLLTLSCEGHSGVTAPALRGQLCRS